MKRSAITINQLLEDMKKDLPKLKVGMIFETLQSIYPDVSCAKESKVVTYGNTSFTKPLACNKKDKKNFLRDKSKLGVFFNEFTRGDFLKIVETDGKVAKCVNLSIKEEIRKAFYKGEFVCIKQEHLLKGFVKPYRRKIEKFYETEENNGL